MKNVFVVFVLAFVGLLSACKSSKNSYPAQDTPTPPVSSSTRLSVGEVLDQIATEIKASLKDVDVTRTREGVLVTFDPQVSFNTSSYVLKPEAKQNIQKLGEVMKKYASTRISVSGHADSTGVQTNNLRLSQERADAFATELKRYAVEPERLITVVGYGATQPKASNKTPEGRRANRRIDGLITVDEKDLQ